ncbi:hypothetical protein NWP17_07135, partial [Chrysosporum bergii ANA360D]
KDEIELILTCTQIQETLNLPVEDGYNFDEWNWLKLSEKLSYGLREAKYELNLHQIWFEYYHMRIDVRDIATRWSLEVDDLNHLLREATILLQEYGSLRGKDV